MARSRKGIGSCSKPDAAPESRLGECCYAPESCGNFGPINNICRAHMQSLPVNGFDMPYLDVGRGPPLVCVHGSLCDFRIWSAVLGPLTQKHRVIAGSLRHFLPARWDGIGDTYSIAQHVEDVIGFVEKFDTKPVDLMGHSR